MIVRRLVVLGGRSRIIRSKGLQRIPLFPSQSVIFPPQNEHSQSTWPPSIFSASGSPISFSSTTDANIRVTNVKRKRKKKKFKHESATALLDRLQSVPLGSLSANDWNTAFQCLKQLPEDTALDMDQRMHKMLALLDRLSQEATQPSSQQPQQKPSWKWTVGPILDVWKEHLQQVDPATMVQKIDFYIATGLINHRERLFIKIQKILDEIAAENEQTRHQLQQLLNESEMGTLTRKLREEASSEWNLLQEQMMAGDCLSLDGWQLARKHLDPLNSKSAAKSTENGLWVLDRLLQQMEQYGAPGNITPLPWRSTLGSVLTVFRSEVVSNETRSVESSVVWQKAQMYLKADLVVSHQDLYSRLWEILVADADYRLAADVYHTMVAEASRTRERVYHPSEAMCRTMVAMIPQAKSDNLIEDTETEARQYFEELQTFYTNNSSLGIFRPTEALFREVASCCTSLPSIESLFQQMKTNAKVDISTYQWVIEAMCRVDGGVDVAHNLMTTELMVRQHSTPSMEQDVYFKAAAQSLIQMDLPHPESSLTSHPTFTMISTLISAFLREEKRAAASSFLRATIRFATDTKDHGLLEKVQQLASSSASFHDIAPERKSPIVPASLSDAHDPPNDTHGNSTENGGFRAHEDSWVHSLFLDRIRSLDVGRLEPQDWFNAWEYFKVQDFSVKGAERSKLLENGFSILDRLALDVEHGNYMGDAAMVYDDTLGKLLMIWAEQMEDSSKEHGSAGETAVSTSMEQFGPATMLRKSLDYFEKGIVVPSPDAFNKVLRVARLVGAANAETNGLGDKVFQCMLERSKNNPRDIYYHPNEETVRHLIQLSPHTLPKRADQLFWMLLNWQQQTLRPDCVPTPDLYCSLMETHANQAKSNTGIVLRRIQELYHKMTTASMSYWDHDRANYDGRTIRAVVACRQQEAVIAAAKILDELCDSYLSTKNMKHMPTMDMFVCIHSGYNNFGHAGERGAAKLLESLDHLYTSTNDDSLHPERLRALLSDNVPRKKVVVKKAAKPKEVEQSYSAEFRSAIKVGPEADESVKESLRRLLSALEKAWKGVPGAAERVAEEKKTFQEITEKHTSHMSVETLNSLLQAYTRVKPSSRGADLAESFVEWMEKLDHSSLHPNGETYFRLMQAVKNTRKPERVEKTLRSLGQKAAAGNISLVNKAPKLFQIGIRSWGESKAPNASDKALEMFQLMKSFNIEATDACYGSVMNAFLRKMFVSNDEFQKALSFFAEAREAGSKRHDKFCVKLMVAANKHYQPEKAEKLFQWLAEDRAAGAKIPRNLVADAYATRLQAWSKSGNPEMTLKVFNEWVADATSGKLERNPSTLDFNAIIDSWSKSKRAEAAQQAELCLRQMSELHEAGQYDCKPDVYSFTACISAHAQSGVAGSGEQALRIFRKLQKMAEGDDTLQPTLVTYLEVMKSLIRHSHGGFHAESAIRQLFDELRHCPASFFDDPHTLLRLKGIKSELHQSGLPSKSSLLNEYTKLEEAISNGALLREEKTTTAHHRHTYAKQIRSF